MKKTKNPAKREKDWMGTGPSSYPILPLSKNEMTGQLIWYNNNCIILMQGFLWVNFFKKKQQQKLFVTQLSQLWMDGLIFSAYRSRKIRGHLDTAYWSSYLFV